MSPSWRCAAAGALRRDVEPVALAHTGGHWHLLAHCRLRAGPRWFRLDRVRAAHPTTEPAPRHDTATEFAEPSSDARAVAL